MLKDELEHALFYASPFPWRIAGNKILSASGEIVCEINPNLDAQRIQANLDLICEVDAFIRERLDFESRMEDMQYEINSLKNSLADALDDEL